MSETRRSRFVVPDLDRPISRQKLGISVRPKPKGGLQHEGCPDFRYRAFAPDIARGFLVDETEKLDGARGHFLPLFAGLEISFNASQEFRCDPVSLGFGNRIVDRSGINQIGPEIAPKERWLAVALGLQIIDGVVNIVADEPEGVASLDFACDRRRQALSLFRSRNGLWPEAAEARR